jgi:predicted ATP-binding protein involved in virulence
MVMNRYLNRITGTIPNTYKEIDIPLNGKNLIITGGNGSGKTSLLRELHKKTELFIVTKKIVADLPNIENELQSNKLLLSQQRKGINLYDHYQSQVTRLENEIANIRNGLQLDIPENINFSSNYDDRVAVVKLFEASRMAHIAHTDTVKSQAKATEEAEQLAKNHNQSFGNKLEEHLVSLKTRESLAKTHDNDFALAEKIQKWFEHFEKNLKLLMEDDSTHLTFDSNAMKFSIQQKDKPAYTFQSLSSGYSSIFDIYADLLMRTEYFKVTPAELVGIAFIDEIDAHLHVSLQKIIFEFLTKSFPKVQFVVTTHSPFVLMSVSSDAVIFDVGRKEVIDEDLSLYSYTAIIEGLLGVKTDSLNTKQLIAEINQIINADIKNYQRLKELVETLRPVKNKLDKRAEAFYLLAVNTLLDNEME